MWALWWRQYRWPLVLILLALALIGAILRWAFAEMALVDAQRLADRYQTWYEHLKAQPPPTCPTLAAPVTAPECPVCPVCAECDPVTCPGETQPLPNGFCLEATFRPDSYEIAIAFHRPAGGWFDKTVMTNNGLLAPELGMMGLSEYDWKFLRAGSRRPCPMGIAPCVWDNTRLLENGNGTMSSLWRTVEPSQSAYVCTSLDWRN